jgi:predicted RNase H-like HicB family nuclease
VTNPAQYPVDIFYSDEDEGFIALASDLPGCSAFGETRADAANEIQDAICAWIEAAEKAGNPIPEPSKRGADSLPSGKILLRLPRTLHGQLVEQAQREGTSLNQFLLYVITSNTSAQLVASAVTDKLMAAASSTNLNTMTSLVGRGLTTLAAANMSAHNVGAAMTEQIKIFGDMAQTATRYVASGTADQMMILDGTTRVVTYGATSRSQRIASIRETGFDPLKRGRVRVHG